MIDVSDLTVTLGGRRTLHGLSLQARPGELTAIAGPNGSGKSTTLKAITGEIAYGGTVRINGADIRNLPGWKLAGLRGVLPQASTISFPFTTREVVGLGLTAGGARPNAEAARQIAQALAAVDLAGFEGRYYQELSGGEQQRVQLARVLCQIPQAVRDGEPCWLLLDEPVSSLDISHQLTIMALAKTFCRQGGGVIAVMHDLNLTAHFADRLILLKKGEIAAAGTPAEVIDTDILQHVFGCALKVNQTPADRSPFVLPQSAIA
ncbi:heme ABC transporter ATP-binding protein [Rhizobium sp. YJ-22]|uniref:heme ABC transporter ATP-binding protein n=1 Tax=Rhizobium sp. YJ-22 TaxID=3037556 RepID=UPI002412311A|nr:heme ABC transporter ATP-binding protein [Rhizobium sp. YJ-22]MDG3576231.1 heme ABC transporter ATP-binding protein [Rhizobium sp. YJ-22]